MIRILPDTEKTFKPKKLAGKTREPSKGAIAPATPKNTTGVKPNAT